MKKLIKSFFKHVPPFKQFFEQMNNLEYQMNAQILKLQNNNNSLKELLEKDLKDTYKLKKELSLLQKEIEKRDLEIRNATTRLEQLNDYIIQLNIENKMRQVDTRINEAYKQMDYLYYKGLHPECYERALIDWYYEQTGVRIDLKNPKTYCEKIQWMKLYDNTPLKTRLSDKYLVREWVAERIGEEYLIPLLGVWNSFDEIDFSILPNQFVLKANHGSGWNVIVEDKKSFDITNARKNFNMWLKTNYAFKYGLELQYLNIQPKIIAEQFLTNGNNDLFDYKVFCFGGKAESIMFLSERKKKLKMAFYDREWNKLPFVYSHPLNDSEIPRPDNLELLIQLAEKLAEGFSHVRVDFYILNDGSLKFGELTFSSASGVCKWNIPEQDFIYGDLIELPEKKLN